MIFDVYNGKSFTKVTVKNEMVNTAFGNYIFTRKLGKKKKK
jgi:ribosomal protein S19